MSETHKMKMLSDRNLPTRLLSKQARVFEIQDDRETFIVVIFKLEGQGFGEHTLLRTCQCETDDCAHVNAAMNQVMTVTFTYNERQGEIEL